MKLQSFIFFSLVSFIFTYLFTFKISNMSTKGNYNFDKVIIHYFSGTGNAKSVTEWIGNQAKTYNIDVITVNIGNKEKAIKQEITRNTLVGFCYPTHGFNAPPIVLKYIWKFARSQYKNKFFVINTRAGLKLSKIFIPGISGIALLLPTIFLWFKGFKLFGYRSIDLPSNWISLHPGIKENVVKSIFTRCKRITKKFSSQIFSGKKVTIGLWRLPIDLALIPISIGYYFYGRFALSKTYIATNACNQCGLCAENCPVNAISIKDNMPFWSYKCESCMKCMNQCPHRAIETPHGFVTIIWWFAFSILPFLIWKFISYLSEVKYPDKDILYQIIYIVLSLSVIFGSYRVLHKLMKFKFFNQIIRYTSLTSYKFWRRYKAPKEI